MTYDTAQLVVPLMDFVVRWGIFNNESRQAARVRLQAAGFDKEELAILVSFLDALETYNEKD